MPSHDRAVDDSALISAALQGEAEAFEQLFDRYYAMIHAFAYRLCFRPVEADDIAQETFIKAARGLATFRGGDFRSWLYRIAANCARDLRRSTARRKQLEIEAAGQMLSDNEAKPKDTSGVSDALTSLPSALREAVALVYFEGLNHAEAAQVLDCAETTVSWRIFRAKRQLKTLLSKSL